VLDICKKEKVTGVLTLIDPELSLLAANRARFEELGVQIIGSDYELCERSFNKMEMFRWCVEHGYACARSYADESTFYSDERSGVISYPVFVKPIRGSASMSVCKACDRSEVELLLAHDKDLMIQEFLEGQEIGADVYVDMISGEVISIFTKRKLLMRAGETDKSVSFKDEKLFDLIKRFVLENGYRGQLDIDLFEINGDYYISEVNPRFGGGYPHAHACGMDHMQLIINNLAGKVNTANIGNYEDGLVMMKYSEIQMTKV
jgi:carbamoyl-phosphate synthase large subunit